MHLVMLESSGNQHYIFGSNRLAEAIGASQLTLEAGVDVAMRATDAVFGTVFKSASLPELTQKLLAQSWDCADGPTVINAMSGKALIAVPDRASGRRLVQEATRIAITEMPGLQFSGFVSERSFAWSDADYTLHDCSLEVHRGIAELCADAHQPIERYRQWPLADICATSGLPARAAHADKGERVRASALALAKHRAIERWSQRAQSLDSDQARIVESFADLEARFDKARKWAVIHADGNGLGGMFQSFAEKVDAVKPTRTGGAGSVPPNAHYARRLCEFSIAIDEATQTAFSDALSVFDTEEDGRRFVPVVPIILGGDDLTAITDANQALAFTAEFLRQYEQQTRASQTIRELTGQQGLTACAGVAIISRHYPFHHAYELAEALIGSAKSIKRHGGGSALDFHVLFDSLTPDLEDSRRCKDAKSIKRHGGGSALDFHVLFDSLTPDPEDSRRCKDAAAYRLTMKPYVVSSSASSDKDKQWAAPRRWDDLDKAAARLAQAINQGEISMRALQRVPEALQRGHAAGESAYGLMRPRQTAFTHWGELLTGSGAELFVAARTPSGEPARATRLLDVLEVCAQGWQL